MILKDLDLSLGVFCITLMLKKLFDISTVLAYSSKKMVAWKVVLLVLGC